MIRFVLPLFPAASQEFAPIAITLGTIGIFYGAWLAFAQTDLKRLLAYTRVSHRGFVILAIYAGTLISLQGLVVQMVAHGLSSAALFIMAGQLYERLHTRDLRLMGGMWGQLRYYPAMLMFFCAALLGIPGTGNFVGEFMILLGAFELYPLFVILATFSLVWAGLYSLILIYQALFGKPSEVIAKNTAVAQPVMPSTTYKDSVPAQAVGKNTMHTATVSNLVPQTTTVIASKRRRGLYDLNRRELALLLVLAAGLVWLGLFPQQVLDASSQSMQWINNAYEYHQVVNIDMLPTQAIEEGR